MILVDETLPEGDLPPPFPAKNVEVKFDVDMRENYDLKKEIGRGRFGTVYLCTCKKTGLKFAAKFVNTKRNQDRENVEREIEIMKTLNDTEAHQKLIQLYDAYDMGKEMCLVLEVVNGGELFERVIDDDFELTERACAIFIKQICEGIEFIHSKNILHLDMKPENILCLSREGNRIKICDFGLARKYDPRKKLQVLFGTPEFVAPEVVNFEPISFGTDMWSIGVICYVLLSGLSPFMGHNYVETMTNVTHNKYDFEDEAFDAVSDDVKDFIERLLLLDKSERLTPTQCYRHGWLRSLDGPAPAPAPKIKLKSSPLNDTTESDVTSSSDTETETEDLSSMDVVVDAKIGFKLLDKDKIINENIVTDLKAPEEEEKEVIIINVKEKEAVEMEEEKSSENKEENVSELKPMMQIAIEPAKKRTNSEANMENSNENDATNAESNSIKLPDEKRKKLRDFDKKELERTKSNLREFVERWNSHPNSPYMIYSPKLPAVICKFADGIYSRESFSSIDCAPPSNPDLLGLEDIDTDDFNLHLQDKTQTVDLFHKKIAHELEQRLENLQNEQKQQELFTLTNESPMKIEPLKHKEVLALQREAAVVHCIPKHIAADKTEIVISKDVKKPEKEPCSVKHRPSRDVINQPDKKYEAVTSPDSCQSPITTPGKRSRKTSKERDDRPSSRDSNRSTPAVTRRRPSRDVPLTLAQVDRLNNLSDSHLDRKSTLDLWPDMICLSKDESDSTESEGDYKPITGILELGMKIPSSNQSDSNAYSKSLDDKQTNFKKAKSCDDQSESKTITWILDLENAKLPFISLEDKIKKNNINETITSKEKRESTLNTEQIPALSLSTVRNELSKSPSSTSLATSSSFDNVTIQTPWGPMRRSPSKTSLKGDEAPIINISECFINVIKPKSDGHSAFKSTPSIELKMSSSPVENNISLIDKRKRFSENKQSSMNEDRVKKSEADINYEVKAQQPNDEKAQQPNDERHPYGLISSGSVGKYSITIPNNFKTHKTFSEIQSDSGNEKASQNQIKVKKKDSDLNFEKNLALIVNQKSYPRDLNEEDQISVSKTNLLSRNSSTKNEAAQISVAKLNLLSNNSSTKNDREISINTKNDAKVNFFQDISLNSKNTPSSISNSTDNVNSDKVVKKVKEIIIPIKRETNESKEEIKIKTEPPKLAKKKIEIIIPIQKDFSSSKDKAQTENKINEASNTEKQKIIPLEKDPKTTSSEKPIIIQIQCGDNNTYPPITRKRSVDRLVRNHLSSEKIDPLKTNSSTSSDLTMVHRTRRRDSSEKMDQAKTSNISSTCPESITIHRTRRRDSSENIDSSATSNMSTYPESVKTHHTRGRDSSETNKFIEPLSHSTVQIPNSHTKSQSPTEQCTDVKKNFNPLQDSTTSISITLKKNSGNTGIFNKIDSHNENRGLSKSPSRSFKQEHIIETKKEVNYVKDIEISKNKILDKRETKENANKLSSIENRNLPKSPSRPAIVIDAKTKSEPSDKNFSLEKNNAMIDTNVSLNSNQITFNIKSRNLSKSPSRLSAFEQATKPKPESSENSNSIGRKSSSIPADEPVNSNNLTGNFRSRNLSKSPSRSSKLDQNSNANKELMEINNFLKKKDDIEIKSCSVKNLNQIINNRTRMPDIGENNVGTENVPENKFIISKTSNSNVGKEQPINMLNNSQNIDKNILQDLNKNKIQTNKNLETNLNAFSDRSPRSSLLNSVSMIAIPTSKYEAERFDSSLVKPQPAHHKSDNIQTENDGKRNSLIENGEYSTNSLRRKSSKGNIPLSAKKSLGAMLFSAQDRISQFEKKKVDVFDDKVLKPVLRSRTSTYLPDSQSNIKPTFNRSSLCESTKNVPSIVCTRV